MLDLILFAILMFWVLIISAYCIIHAVKAMFWIGIGSLIKLRAEIKQP